MVGSVHHLDGIQIDDDGSQGLPTSVNVGSAPSIPQARGAGDHGGTTQNKYVNFLSQMDEKSDTLKVCTWDTLFYVLYQQTIVFVNSSFF